MKKKTLSNTNPFLVKKASAQKSIIRSIASSTAIETGKPIQTIENKLNHSKSATRAKLA